MSTLPGFRKAGVTKFSELEMEDTFLHNLQVMNGGNKNFNLEDSLLTFQYQQSYYKYQLDVGVLPNGEETIIQNQILNNQDSMYDLSMTPGGLFISSNEIEDQESISTRISSEGMFIHAYNEETQQFYDTQPVLLNEQEKIDSQYLPEYTTGITKASEMNQTSFWDTDVIVPTGHTLTNADGLNAGQITSGTFSTDRIPSLNADQITSGTFSTGRIPSLSAGKITSGTFPVERIPNLTTSKITDLETTLGDYVTTSALTTTLENYVESSALSDYVTSSSLTTTLSNYVEDSDLTTALSSYVTSTTLNTTLTGYASLDDDQKISVNAIPDLGSTYAKLNNNKINASVIPNLSSTAGITIDASLITNAPWKSTLKLSEMEIDQDLNMDTHTIYVGTTTTGKTAIYNRGIQTITGVGDTYEFLNGELIASSIDSNLMEASTYRGLPTSKLSNLNIDVDLDMGNKNITTTGTVTASNIPSST